MDDDIHLRRATPADLESIMHQRIEMFREMGHSEDEIAAMAKSGRPYFAAGLASGNYQGWLFEDGSGVSVAGAGRPLYELLGFEPTNEMRLRFK